AAGAGVLAGPSVGAITNVSKADGGNAPDFAWSDGRGQHKLSDYRGKVVMINFWGTWCPPCRRELPALVKIREELAPEKFEIIGINIGEREQAGSTVQENVTRFAKENGILYPLVIGDENLVNAYGGVEVVPTTIIVDGTGKIVERIEGSRDEAGFRSVIGRAM
ncbi:MAG: TlpA family protein disulfide reductase, partial [bacterium]|nr:TlpA family protein disulfide reductase [Candidatus Kapabacteria bacterium]